MYIAHLGMYLLPHFVTVLITHMHSEFPCIFSIASAAAPPLVSKFSHRSGCIVSILQTGSPVWCSCTLLGDTHMPEGVTVCPAILFTPCFYVWQR